MRPVVLKKLKQQLAVLGGPDLPRCARCGNETLPALMIGDTCFTCDTHPPAQGDLMAAPAVEQRTPVRAPTDAFTHLDEAGGVAVHVATFHNRADIYVDNTLPKTRYFVRGPNDAPPENYSVVYRITRTVLP